MGQEAAGAQEFAQPGRLCRGSQTLRCRLVLDERTLDRSAGTRREPQMEARQDDQPNGRGGAQAIRQNQSGVPGGNRSATQDRKSLRVTSREATRNASLGNTALAKRGFPVRRRESFTLYPHDLRSIQKKNPGSAIKAGTDASAFHGRRGRSGCTPAEPYPPCRINTLHQKKNLSTAIDKPHTWKFVQFVSRRSPSNRKSKIQNHSIPPIPACSHLTQVPALLSFRLTNS